MTTTPTTEATPNVEPPESTPLTVPAQDPAGGDDPAAEVARLKDELAKARKWEDRAKSNAQAAKELETLKQSTMTDIEKAAATAKAEGRAEAARELAEERVLDKIRVAAAGRPVDLDALLEGVSPSKFLDTDGQPDTKAISAWVDRVAPAGTGQPAKRDLGLGARGQQTPALNGDPLLRDLEAKLGIR